VCAGLIGNEALHAYLLGALSSKQRDVECIKITDSDSGSANCALA